MRIPESRPRLVLSLSASPLLLLLVWGAWQVGAPPVFTALLAVFAVGLGWVVLVDLPTVIEVDPDAFRRVCLLRTQRVSWGKVAAIVRPRRGALVLLTEDRKRVFLVSRNLTQSETDYLREQAIRRNVRVDF
jgi:hypothetical protein